MASYEPALKKQQDTQLVFSGHDCRMITNHNYATPAQRKQMERDMRLLSFLEQDRQL